MPVLIGVYNLVDRPFFLTLHLYCDFFKTFFSLSVWGGGGGGGCFLYDCC